MAQFAKFERQLLEGLERAKSTAVAAQYIPYESQRLRRERGRNGLLEADCKCFFKKAQQLPENKCSTCKLRAQLLIEAEAMVLRLLEERYSLEFRLYSDCQLEDANGLVRRLYAQLQDERTARGTDTLAYKAQAKALREYCVDAKNEGIAAQTVYLNAIIYRYKIQNAELCAQLQESREYSAALQRAAAKAEANLAVVLQAQQLPDLERYISEGFGKVDSALEGVHMLEGDIRKMKREQCELSSQIALLREHY